jgi:hypothetical protein
MAWNLRGVMTSNLPLYGSVFNAMTVYSGLNTFKRDKRWGYSLTWVRVENQIIVHILEISLKVFYVTPF